MLYIVLAHLVDLKGRSGSLQYIHLKNSQLSEHVKQVSDMYVGSTALILLII